MIVCPLCEHPQATSGECAVCGRMLSGTPEQVVTSRLEGLEPTFLAEGLAVPVETVPGLEPTQHAPAMAALDSTPDLEPTRLGGATVAADTAVETVDGFEPTLADPLPWEERTPPVVAPSCRYCRSPAHPGEVLCGRCGMRLPVIAQVETNGPPDRHPVRCPSCGSPSSGGICTGCGGRVPFS